MFDTITQEKGSSVVCVNSAGEATVNLTSLYDIVTKQSKALGDLTRELEETKERLSIAEEKLKIGKMIFFWLFYF